MAGKSGWKHEVIARNKSVRSLLYWAPRVLCIAFAAFMSLFALDVFSEGYGFWQTMLALLMHLIPAAIIVVVLIVSWRWEWVGGVLFIAFGMLYLTWAWKHPDWVWFISGPLFLVGALFFVNWVKREELQANP